VIISMTGFASKSVELPLPNNELLLLTIQLKSLNSRYFEIAYKIPPIFHNLEVHIYRYLKQTLQRGHVFLHIKIHNPIALTNAVTPSVGLIKNYIQAIERIKKEANITTATNIADILRLPNVLHADEINIENESETALLHHIQELAQDLIENQKQEGLELKNDLHLQFNSVQQQIELIRTTLAEVIKIKKQSAAECMDKITQTTDLNDLSILEIQKNTLLHDVEKSDINEELVRFAAHIKNILELIESPVTSKGKKLDFILQEMNREINTMAAKCPHVSISKIVIDIKSELEKAREQSQNIV
jgi:uncharacterized protein (TIGR00255 family)